MHAPAAGSRAVALRGRRFATAPQDDGDAWESVSLDGIEREEVGPQIPASIFHSFLNTWPEVSLASARKVLAPFET